MHIERWSPLSDLLNVQNEVDRMFHRTFGRQGGRKGTEIWAPSLESYARGDDLVVRLEIPGIDVGKVDISVTDHSLRVSGERQQHETVREEDSYFDEISYGCFERSLALPGEAKAEDIKATYENGILEIIVPQATKAAASGRKVPIEVKK